MQPGMIDPKAFLQVLVLIAMAVGLAGLIIPIFPGLVVIWGAALGYGIAEGFGLKGWVLFILITVLMVAGSLIDNILMGKRGHETGASWWGLAGAWLAGIAGSILFPPLGGIPASILAVFLIEWARRRNWRLAVNVTRSVAVGCGWAYVIRLVMGVAMVGFFILWAIT
jgi:uncharacterized protein YqgC (DUF456 family)